MEITPSLYTFLETFVFSFIQTKFQKIYGIAIKQSRYIQIDICRIHTGSSVLEIITN